MLLRLLIAAVVTTSSASAISPWDDPTIEIDADAERELLTQLRDTRKKIAQHQYELFRLGLARADNSSLADTAYFVAASKLAWAQGEFEQSYRLAQLATMEMVRAEPALTQSLHRGLVNVDVVLEAQASATNSKLVLLRFESLAKQRGIELQKVDPKDYAKLREKELAPPRGDNPLKQPPRTPAVAP